MRLKIDCFRLSKGFVALVLTAILIGGCTSTYRLNVESRTSASTTFILKDQRSEKEKLGGSRSRDITDCNFAITDISEVDIQPSRMVALRNALQERSGEKLAGKTVVITSFKVIRNWQSQLRDRRDSTQFRGLANELVKALACYEADPKDGGFLVDENPNALPSFTVLIVGNVNGRELSVRHFGTAASLDDTIPKNPQNVLPGILDRAVAEFARQINSVD